MSTERATRAGQREPTRSSSSRDACVRAALIDSAPVLAAIVADLRRRTPPAVIAAGFHRLLPLQCLPSAGKSAITRPEHGCAQRGVFRTSICYPSVQACATAVHRVDASSRATKRRRARAGPAIVEASCSRLAESLQPRGWDTQTFGMTTDTRGGRMCLGIPGQIIEIHEENGVRMDAPTLADCEDICLPMSGG